MTDSPLLLATLQRMEAKIDSMSVKLASVAERVDVINDDLDAHVNDDKQALRRVERLEHWRTAAMSYVAVIAGIASVLVTYAKDALSWLVGR